jgi:peptide/nickel transport system permease protein
MNLTISVDPEVLKQARLRAVQENTSVNAVLREYLESYAGLKKERQAAIARLGLDQPMWKQYLDYMGQLLTGDMGTSYFYNQPVFDILTVKFWNTIFLMLGAYSIAIVGGILFGGLLAWWRGTKFEHIGILIPFVFRSMPTFWIGILLVIIFVFQLGWFPVAGISKVGVQFDGFWDRYLRTGFLYHMFLPMLSGAIYYSAIPTLLMRNTMLEILNADFIEIKRAEGLSQVNILYKHAVRNSLLPIVTVAAIVAGKAVGGQVLIEVVFNWPGMGRAMIDAVYANDYPLAMGAFFLMGATLITMNFIADLLYAYLDPRVSYD